MGTLSLAFDRLFTMTSSLAFAKTGQHKGVDLSQLEVSLDQHAMRAFEEFNTGMYMLHKHAVHNGCNSQEIAQQNLKLLHTNLKTSKTYRGTINYIRNSRIESPQWNWIPLFDNTGIKAGLLYLAAGNMVRFKKPGSATTLRQSSLFAPFSQANSTQLYLGLKGNTLIECSNTSGEVTARKQIKSGDAYTEDTDRCSIHRLNAGKESCLLLNILLDYAHSTA